MNLSSHVVFRRVIALVVGLVVAANVFAAQAGTETVSPYTMTPGRLGAGTGGLLALVGVVAGVLALARRGGRLGTGTGQRGAIVALTTGLIGMALGGLVAATAKGGIGTGNGLGGAFVALVLGLIATILGGIVLARSPRTA